MLKERLDSSTKSPRGYATSKYCCSCASARVSARKEYRQLPKLKFIAQTGRTTAHLDLPAATERGIAVAGTPSDSGTTTKELTIGLILSLLRKIPQVNARMRDGKLAGAYRHHARRQNRWCFGPRPNRHRSRPDYESIQCPRAWLVAHAHPRTRRRSGRRVGRL